MKLSEIKLLEDTLILLSQKELPFRVSYKISKMLSLTEKDAIFFTKKFRDIIQKYALRDEKGEIVFEGDNVKIDSTFLSAAEKELAELNDLDIDDIDVFFTLEELENLEIKPSELQALLPFIKEE